MDRIMYVIIFAFILDLLIGDPQNPFHPIRMIGNGISFFVSLYKKINIKNPLPRFCFGVVLSLTIIFTTYFVAKITIDVSSGVHTYLGFAVEVVLCYFIIAAKALKVESMKVYKSIENNNLEEARKNLSYIVGRDTENLSFPQIIKGTVETISENLSDGVIAPLIFVFVGGVPLGLAYKAINTLDSMIGYKNETYEYLGKFAARLDDVANFFPSRISAVFMILSTLFTGMDTKQAIKIFRRDRFNHKSPNSAQTEAVCAGALGLCFGGDNYYKGVLVHKPTIGDEINLPDKRHILDANKMMYVTAILLIGFMMLIDVIRGYLHV